MDRLTSQIATYIHTQFQVIQNWSTQRQLKPTFWLAVVAASITSLFIIIALISVFTTQPTYRTQHFEPFSSLEEYNQFLSDNPLYLAPEANNRAFRMTRHIRADKQAIYTFQLTAPSLRPSMTPAQKTSYLHALRQSQQEALDWIKQQDVDPQTVNLIWRPDPTDMAHLLQVED